MPEISGNPEHILFTNLDFQVAFVSILENDYSASPLKQYHDALQKKEEADNLFNLGYLRLEDKGLADALFWKICQDLVLIYREEKIQPEEMDRLKAMMADQYVCNFSVFQSFVCLYFRLSVFLSVSLSVCQSF